MSAADRYGMTPLHVAAYAGEAATVELLVELGSDVNAVNDAGGTILHNACNNPRTGHPTLELLLKHGAGADINARQRPRGTWPVVTAACRLALRMTSVKSAAVRELAFISGATPLHRAAMAGRTDTVRWLLDNGAALSLQMRNRLGYTPYLAAHKCGPYEQVKAELAHAVAPGSPVDWEGLPMNPQSGRGSRSPTRSRWKKGSGGVVSVVAAEV